MREPCLKKNCNLCNLKAKKQQGAFELNKALFIIDMQNDFVLPQGVLCVKGASATIPGIKKLLEHARAENWTIVHVIREHDKDGINADKPRCRLFENAGHGYCVADSFGAQIVKELGPLENEIILKKTRNSAFFETNLDLILRRLDVKRIFVCGTQYPNCIRATANDAMSYDYDVTVVTDCCSAQSEDVARANIFDMKNMGIECLSLNEII